MTDVFEGQPKSDPLSYQRDLGSAVDKRGQRYMRLGYDDDL